MRTYELDDKTRAVIDVGMRWVRASPGQEFTSDDIRAACERAGVPMTGPVVGSAMREIKAMPEVRQVGERPSRRRENHGRKVDVLIYGGPQVRTAMGVAYQSWSCPTCVTVFPDPRVTHTAEGARCERCGGALVLTPSPQET